MDDLDGDGPSSDKFSAVAEKLNAPKKISQFERARQEAEIKRLKEEAEARAALREFEDSFADADDGNHRSDDGSDGGVFGDYGRDRPQSGSKGTRGPAHGPPPSLKRKRELEQLEHDRGKPSRGDDRSQGFSGQGHGARSAKPPRLAGLDDEEDYDLGRLQKRHSPEASVRKPTLLLQCLPSSTTEQKLRGLMPDFLKVEDVEFVSDGKQRGDADRTRSALVAVSAATPISEVDKTVTVMQNQYLGFGCFLKITRHVSAAGRLGSVDTSVLSLTNTAPFGATHVVAMAQGRPGPQSSFKRMAPPSSFNAMAPAPPRQTSGLKVSVAVPTDIKLLKLIHGTFEMLVTYGIEFEALLMAQSTVQRDEKWSWLFDSTSQAGVYYRWLIWKHLSGTLSHTASEDEIFTAGPLWLPPTDQLRYVDVCEFQDIAEHPDYVSSDEDSGDESSRPSATPRQQQGPGSLLALDEVGTPTAFDNMPRYLGPYRRAKLTHLLARLPESIALLRSGDVARATHFVIHNAGSGAEEIVDMMISNAEVPFNHCVKYADSAPLADTSSTSPAEAGDRDRHAAAEPTDHSNSQLIALYLISDVLLTSATSGVRDAWKYRTLFEQALVSRGLFARLVRVERDLKWGRLKAEQWRRKVGLVLDLWGSASVFGVDSAKEMRRQFTEDQTAVDQTSSVDDRDRGSWKIAADRGVPDKGFPDVVPAVVPTASTRQLLQAADAEEKIRALRERMATSSRAPASSVAAATSTASEVAVESAPTTFGAGTTVQSPLSSTTTTTGQPPKRGRMTAADLFDAPEEPAPERKVQSFGFSLSIGQTGETSPITNDVPPPSSTEMTRPNATALHDGKAARVGFALGARAVASGGSRGPGTEEKDARSGGRDERDGRDRVGTKGMLESDSE